MAAWVPKCEILDFLLFVYIFNCLFTLSAVCLHFSTVCLLLCWHCQLFIYIFHLFVYIFQLFVYNFSCLFTFFSDISFSCGPRKSGIEHVLSRCASTDLCKYQIHLQIPCRILITTGGSHKILFFGPKLHMVLSRGTTPKVPQLN